MIRMHPPLPDLPGIPTAPLGRADLALLARSIQDCRPMRAWAETQDHLVRAYAILWLHLALERRLDPRHLLSPGAKGYLDLLAAFVQQARSIGWQDPVTLKLAVPQAALRACSLWMEAKESQREVLMPLPGLQEAPS